MIKAQRHGVTFFPKITVSSRDRASSVSFLLKEGNMFSLKTCCLRHQDERCLDTDPVFFVFFFSLHTDDAVQSTDTQDTAEVTAFINSGEAMGWSHEGHCLQLKADMGSNANSATDISVRLGKLCNITGVQFPCL